MCYSAQVWESFAKFTRVHGAVISFPDFVRLYIDRANGEKIRIPKALDANFANPSTDDELRIAELIAQFDRKLLAGFEQEIFKQRRRLADAERQLATKPTKKAMNDQRIATNKVSQLRGKIEDLKRTEDSPRDSRIFPGSYSVVMILRDGKPTLVPMRYQCRLAGKPADYDVRFPGTYNARRDNLRKFWRGQFGVTHGIIVVDRFYENVARIDESGVEKNVVLEFVPQDREPMLVACLWSQWTGEREPDLLSFAAITDEPPEEVAAAGHDRCIVPIKRENVMAWLRGGDLDAMEAILDDRPRPYYEHRLAA
jgi:putative SOS response-associated peptidase YedK